MNVSLSGRVVRGEQYGKKLGFPTANLDRRQFARLARKPKLGIYAGIAQINRSSKKYKAGIVIGPLDSATGLPKIEAHLLGFKGILYGQHLTLSLSHYLRPFGKFFGETALKSQIRKDISKVKKLIK